MDGSGEGDTVMTEAHRTKPSKRQRATELVSSTIRAPPFSYIHLDRDTVGVGADVPDLDALQVRSYCDAALQQFLGVTGSAIPIDILKVNATECWLRVPQEDLGAFTAALTAWPGIQQGTGRLLLRVRACGDWLGSLVGRQGQDRLWSG